MHIFILKTLPGSPSRHISSSVSAEMEARGLWLPAGRGGSKIQLELGQTGFWEQPTFPLRKEMHPFP